MGNDERTRGETRRELNASYPGRIDAILAAACPDLSRARLQRLIAAGHVQVNGSPVRKSVQVVPGDHLVVDVPAVEHAAVADVFELPVLYEDDDLVVIDKPAGLAVHGGPNDQAPSVVTWFIAHYPACAAKFDAERPGIVHRLDKDTSGVLLVAKTPTAQAALSACFEARTTHKQYIAICDGTPPRERAVVEADIARHPGDRTKMAVSRHGREARTEYEVLASDSEHSLLLVHPITGRTHQIRVHLAAIGAPVSCDRTYGKGEAGARQLLHAWRLTVPHPAGGALTVTAPLPPDMLDAALAMGAAEAARPYGEAVPPERSEDSA
jgi:23S rRNA pseudouridine1911/1915/1917 synthase